jgi:molecular chaperone GrpE
MEMAEQEEERQAPASAETAGPDDAENAADAGAENGDLEMLRKDLDEANRKGQEYLGLLQRTKADFVNYRRRVDQERGESLNSGKAMLALRILPVLDDFDRALKAMPGDLAKNEWAQGIELIARKMNAALEAEGIARIQALGAEFNPWEHEAMMHAPSTEEQSGRVIEVYREGYKQGDKVLRPAQVIVGRGEA